MNKQNRLPSANELKDHSRKGDCNEGLPQPQSCCDAVSKVYSGAFIQQRKWPPQVIYPLKSDAHNAVLSITLRALPPHDHHHLFARHARTQSQFLILYNRFCEFLPIDINTACPLRLTSFIAWLSI